MISKGAVLFTTLFGARVLSVDQFGTLLSLQAIMLLSVAAWDLGISQMLVRDLAAGQWSLSDGVGTGASFRVRTLPMWLVVYAIGSFLVGINSADELASCLLLAFAGLLNGSSTMLDAALRGELKFRTSAFTVATGRLVYACCVAAIVLARPAHAMPIMAMAFLVGEAVVLVSQLPSFRQSLAISAVMRPIQFVSTLRRALPYALSGFFALVYNRADILLVTVLAGATQAGLYAPSSRLQDAMMLLPATAVAGLIPVAAKTHRTEGGESLKHALFFSVSVSFGVTFPATVAMFFLLPWALPHVMGGGYGAALAPARVLIWAVPIASVEAPILSILVAQGRAKLSTMVYGAALTASVLGLLVLAPTHGAVGAAWASFLREPVALVVALAVLFFTAREF